MKTNKDGVYAIGDITQFPLAMAKDSIVNIQHYQMAQQQGDIFEVEFGRVFLSCIMEVGLFKTLLTTRVI